MTQEDKELLLRDLCARLPYHVRCKIWLKDGTTEEGLLDLKHNYGNVLQDAFYYNKIKDIKPYLRPMSSMTEEERKEYLHITLCDVVDCEAWNEVDWLNKHHFDYRGLIEKGLALQAPEGMYNLNK
jgi:hypothetical protein